jgi:hypothetical protein
MCFKYEDRSSNFFRNIYELTGFEAVTAVVMKGSIF